LLLKVLETNPGLSVDGKKIAAAWPTDRGEVPTPRAITEHIITIRKKSDASSTGGTKTSTPRGRKPSQTSSSATPTKRRRRTVNPKASISNPTTPTKSVKFEGDLDSDEVDSIINNLTSRNNNCNNGTSTDEDEDTENESPSKKPRTNHAGTTSRHGPLDDEECDELAEDVDRGDVKRLSSIVV
ncbi:hypothetical protein GP486_008336, partial [Trichoglossum hirsutum]